MNINWYSPRSTNTNALRGTLAKVLTCPGGLRTKIVEKQREFPYFNIQTHNSSYPYFVERFKFQVDF